MHSQRLAELSTVSHRSTEVPHALILPHGSVFMKTVVASTAIHLKCRGLRTRRDFKEYNTKSFASRLLTRSENVPCCASRPEEKLRKKAINESKNYERCQPLPDDCGGGRRHGKCHLLSACSPGAARSWAGTLSHHARTRLLA